MKKTSPFSATEIGQNNSTGYGPLIRSHFREESKVVCEQLQGIHYARKLGFMQVNYSDTVNKMSDFQKIKPVTLDGTLTTTSHSNTNSLNSTMTNTHGHKQDNTNGIGYNNFSMNKSMKMREYEAQMAKNVSEESQLNYRKRLYNREVGRKAAVNEIMAGSAPMPKYVLFAQKMNHNQILAMTGSLAAPDARNVPPLVPKRKKWLGEGVGWETVQDNA